METQRCTINFTLAVCAKKETTGMSILLGPYSASQKSDIAQLCIAHRCDRRKPMYTQAPWLVVMVVLAKEREVEVSLQRFVVLVVVTVASEEWTVLKLVE